MTGQVKRGCEMGSMAGAARRGVLGSLTGVDVLWGVMSERVVKLENSAATSGSECSSKVRVRSEALWTERTAVGLCPIALTPEMEPGSGSRSLGTATKLLGDLSGGGPLAGRVDSTGMVVTPRFTCPPRRVRLGGARAETGERDGDATSSKARSGSLSQLPVAAPGGEASGESRGESPGLRTTSSQNSLSVVWVPRVFSK